MSDVATRGFPARILGAALLRPGVYEEVEHDRDATLQAGVIVLLSSLVAAMPDGWMAVPFLTVWGILGWWLWAGITYLIGDKLLGGTATWGELLRALGFAQVPKVLLVLDPVVGGVGFVVWPWLLAAVVVALREALDFGIWKTLLTALVGAVPYFVIRVLVFS